MPDFVSLKQFQDAISDLRKMMDSLKVDIASIRAASDKMQSASSKFDESVSDVKGKQNDITSRQNQDFQVLLDLNSKVSAITSEEKEVSIRERDPVDTYEEEQEAKTEAPIADDVQVEVDEVNKALSLQAEDANKRLEALESKGEEPPKTKENTGEIIAPPSEIKEPKEEEKVEGNTELEERISSLESAIKTLSAAQEEVEEAPEENSYEPPEAESPEDPIALIYQILNDFDRRILLLETKTMTLNDDGTLDASLVVTEEQEIESA